MAKDAYPFLVPLSLISLLFLVSGIAAGGIFFLCLGAFTAYFFRDPERKIPLEPELIVSPADGKVVSISQHPDGTTRVSIFLSVFDVHINRAPIEGRVESVTYIPGRFRVAFDEKASLENEQNILVIGNASSSVRFSQIAGILARRIVCWKKTGDTVAKGERVGLIKFGSRVDVFLPGNSLVMVELGDRVRGGSSIIGRFQNA
jgi:phosphatidylserine decarboxylase